MLCHGSQNHAGDIAHKNCLDSSRSLDALRKVVPHTIGPRHQVCKNDRNYPSIFRVIWGTLLWPRIRSAFLYLRTSKPTHVKITEILRRRDKLRTPRCGPSWLTVVMCAVNCTCGRSYFQPFCLPPFFSFFWCGCATSMSLSPIFSSWPDVRHPCRCRSPLDVFGGVA